MSDNFDMVDDMAEFSDNTWFESDNLGYFEEYYNCENYNE